MDGLYPPSSFDNVKLEMFRNIQIVQNVFYLRQNPSTPRTQ